MRAMSERLISSRVRATVADIVDLSLELLPDYELAAITVLDGAERPAEWPTVRRRLRAEGIRASEHGGVLLLAPGELDRASSVGMLGGGSGADELYLMREWDDEFEAFAQRITSDLQDFNDGTPLGLEEWMDLSGCLLALGDGSGLNFATLDADLAERLRRRFPAAQK
jgi:hypothetical protein